MENHASLHRQERLCHEVGWRLLAIQLAEKVEK